MKKKNVIGALVMAAAIVASLPLGINRSFDRLREDVEGHYYLDLTGYSVCDGVNSRVDAARNLLTLSERYVEQDPELDVYRDELERRVQICEHGYDVETADRQVQANQAMGDAAEALAERLETLELSEKDAKYPRQLLADMDSEQDKMERSSYNDEAREYNARLEKFPVNYLGDLAGLKPLGMFGPGSGPAAEAAEAADQ